MPPLVAAVAAKVTASVIAATGITSLAFAQAIYIGTQVALYVAGSLALNMVSSALFGKPKLPDLSGGSFGVEAGTRTQIVRSSVVSQRLPYGETMLSGPLVFAETTGSGSNTLHMVVALGLGEVEAIDSVYFNDVEIRADQIDENGDVIGGKYSGKAQIIKHLGTADQEADDRLVTNVEAWTEDHRLRGICYLYVRLQHDRDVFATGIPNVKAVVRGRKVHDPRDAADKFSANPALVLRDYLRSDLGLNASDDEIDDASFIAAANICEEMVGLTVCEDDFTVEIDGSDWTATREDTDKKFQTGERVTVDSTDTLPAGLSTETDYFYIRRGADRFRLAASYEDALAGTAVEVTDEGSGTHTLTLAAHARYDCHGSVELDRAPIEAVENILTCCGGQLVYTQGKYHMHVAAATTATSDIDATWLRDKGVKISPRVPRQQLFNQVRGTFVDPDRFWQPTDFPPVANETYETQDGGERMIRDIELPFTQNATRAQRIGKIHLERSRQGITVTLHCNFKALHVAVWDVVTLTLDQMGWNEKLFRVLEWRLADDLGIDLILQEEAEEAYDWAAGDATILDPAPDTNLAPALTVSVPGIPVIAEDLYSTREGSGIKARALVSWTASVDAFVSQYELQYKLQAAATWTVAGQTPDTEFTIPDIAPGIYLFRVRGQNRLGVTSDWATTGLVEIYGLSAAPADIAGLTLTAAGGFALLRWTLPADLDVRQGGRVLFRHSPLTSGASWSVSTTIGEAVDGAMTSAILPLKAGTYLVKAQDASGVRSVAAATVSTKQASVLAWSTLQTVIEHAAWNGGHSGTVIDGDDGYLKLGGGTDVDDLGDVDDLDDWDAAGGVALSGTYTFGTGIDLGSVKHVRLTGGISAGVVNVLDDIDARPGLVDDWEEFDGTAAASADCQIWVRETDDDPSASPTWSDWQRLDSGEFEGRGFQAQARLSTDDAAYNIRVSALTLTAEEIA
jgi:hypothetical protein